MKLSRFHNIVSIQSEPGDVTFDSLSGALAQGENAKTGIIGFHAENLQVADLEREVLGAIRSLNALKLKTSDLENLPDVRAQLLSTDGNLIDSELSEVTREVLNWDQEKDLEVRDQILQQNVRSFTINIAQICNLKCTYCAAGGDGTYGSDDKRIDLTKVYDQLQMLLHSVPKDAEFVITFLGGEPLIYPTEISQIARFARLQVAGRNIRLRFDIVTNGTLVTREIALLLASLSANVTVSLDGPPEINDRQRPTAGGLGSTLRTLRGLKNLTDVRHELGSLSVGSVFGKHFTDVEATYEFLKPFDLDSIKFDFAADLNDEAASDAYTASLLRVADRAYLDGGEAALCKLGLFDKTFRVLESRERVHNHCGAGKSLLQVDTSGKLYACQWFVNDPEEVLGDGAFIDTEKLAAYADPVLELNGCRSCWARFICGGGCMHVNKTKTGSKHQRDQVFCQRTRSIIAKGIQLYAHSRTHQQPTS